MGWIFVPYSQNVYAEFLSLGGVVSVGGAYGKWLGPAGALMDSISIFITSERRACSWKKKKSQTDVDP